MSRTRWILAVCILGLALLGLVACQQEPEQALAPTATKTLRPTYTPLQPTATPVLPTATKFRPTVTKTATTAPTETPEPTEEPTATPEPPTATPVPPTPEPKPEQAAAAEEPAVKASSGQVAAQPKGSPLTYEPEFPGPAPASEPPSHDDHTNPLSGVHVDDANAINRRPVMVRYGNDSAARPHSGISQAEVVFEDVMDAWWITRITAVYLQHQPEQAGPLRSARPVNVELLPAFDGVLVFSGASIGVTQLLAQQPFDLIHEGSNGDLFYRGSDRPAPHNLYTSVSSVRERMGVLGWERDVDLRGFAFSADAPAGESVSRIDIPYPKTSTVAWTWDGGAGVYRRWVKGAPYTEHLTGEQVGCANVVVLYAKHWESDIVEDSRGSTSIGIALRGSERVQIFRDGRVIEGSWYRSESNKLFQFVDGNGNHIPLKPGNTWIQLVPTSYSLGVS